MRRRTSSQLTSSPQGVSRLDSLTVALLVQMLDQEHREEELFGEYLRRTGSTVRLWQRRHREAFGVPTTQICAWLQQVGGC